jgi:NAD(P)-dependent dehydrogenase (short-subunit alcohol dehydrogenase family)
METMRTTKPAVAVFGATGHTGRFVVAELLRRGMTPIAIARDEVALAAAVFPEFEVFRRHTTVDDRLSLDRALHGAQAVINCAGPFVDTADAVASAAMRAEIHYVDVCAEQETALATLTKFDEPARQAGVAVVPSVAFYGGFADLMVSAVLGDWWECVDSIDIMIGLDSWHPTHGTRVTVDRRPIENLMITGGRLTPVSSEPATRRWNFGHCLGEPDVVEVPFTETILISRHLKTDELHNYLSHVAVSDVLNPATPAPKAADAMGRSVQRFVIDVVITRNGQRRRAIAKGQDIYAISAPLACAAVERLLEGKFHLAGANPPGFIFDAEDLLGSLGPSNSTFKMITA